MKKSISTIGFMTLITIVCISILAFINETSRVRIAQNQKIEQSKSILYAFDIFPPNFDETVLDPAATTNAIPWTEQEIIREIQNQIKTITLPVDKDLSKLLEESYLPVKDSVTVFIRHNEAGEVIAYGFPMKGKGLWGTISAFGVISADLQKMVGIDFTEQVETPGLGARITEVEFKYFFRNLNLKRFYDDSVEQPIFLVKEKKQSNVENSTNSLQAITGATQTVDGVRNMLNIDLKFYIEFFQDNEQLLKQAVS